MLKYTPRTGAWGETDVCQVTLTPAADPDNHLEQRQSGAGTVRFHKATGRIPTTMHHVVNALAALPVIEARGGAVTRSHAESPTATSACSCSAGWHLIESGTRRLLHLAPLLRGEVGLHYVQSG